MLHEISKHSIKVSETLKAKEGNEVKDYGRNINSRQIDCKISDQQEIYKGNFKTSLIPLCN